MNPTLRLFVCLFSFAITPPAFAQSADDSLMSSADARIEKHRKAEASLTVTDASGQPIPNARVTVRQTRHAFLFGCNIFRWGRIEDADLELAYRQQFTELLNFATLPFYWPTYEPKRGEPQHDSREAIARWCREQGIATKGHPLAWNYSDADWFPDDAESLRRLQMERIDDCVGHFAGLIDCWDVVNEVTHYDRAEFADRRAPKFTSMWKATGQIEFTRECFRHARQASANATLLINDYRTDPAYERVIEQLVDNSGKPLYDVIGLQSHMHSGTMPNTKLWDICERFSRFGVPLHFTEMTILSGEQVGQKDRDKPWPSTQEGEAYQAREVARVYKLLFSHPSVEAITWWDFSDDNAWKGAPAGLLRKDMSSKPAYNVLQKLIKDQWWTTTDVLTDSAGKAKFRGFLGNYALEIHTVDGKPMKFEVAVRKGQDNQFSLQLQ